MRILKLDAASTNKHPYEIISIPNVTSVVIYSNEKAALFISNSNFYSNQFVCIYRNSKTTVSYSKTGFCMLELFLHATLFGSTSTILSVTFSAFWNLLVHLIIIALLLKLKTEFLHFGFVFCLLKESLQVSSPCFTS